jgi:hypothetical protein
LASASGAVDQTSQQFTALDILQPVGVSESPQCKRRSAKVSVASTNMRPLRFVSFGQQDMALIENGTVDFAATYLRICGA